jgi:outer membrane protein assembly factor BamD
MLALRSFPCGWRWLALLALAGITTACGAAFQPAKFSSNEELYRASLAKLEHHKWGDAAAGFDRLTLQLPARDTLMPRSMYYLGKAHEENQEYLLAAQAYNRMAETFPADTLADDALYRAGVSYAKLWRKPSLDATYGQLAMSTLQGLLDRYPTSPLLGDAQQEIAHLNEWLATKTYDNGLFYVRRKSPYSAIIYFQDVVQNYPTTPQAKEALLRLVDIYRDVRYLEDAKDACATLHQRYPSDGDVLEACGPPPSTAAAPSPNP